MLAERSAAIRSWLAETAGQGGLLSGILEHPGFGAGLLALGLGAGSYDDGMRFAANWNAFLAKLKPSLEFMSLPLAPFGQYLLLRELIRN